MEEYDKEKLHEYAKELFALCLEKGIPIETYADEQIFVYDKKIYITYLTKDLFTFSFVTRTTETNLPIWELIEKVKAL